MFVNPRFEIMTDSPHSTPIWRVPKPARSWERFHRILDAAAELFVEIGYDSVTTDEIAARAIPQLADCIVSFQTN